MNRCEGGGELKNLRISTAFSHIHSKIHPKVPLSDADLDYIRRRVETIRRDWRTTSEAERFFTALERIGSPGLLSEQQYDDMVKLCDRFTNEFLDRYRAGARTQDDDD